MSASCTVPGSNGGVRSAGACGSPLDLGSEEDLKDVAGPSSGGRRNKRKNFQPRNIRHDDDQPLDLTETDEESLRKRSKLVTDDEDGRSTTSCSTGEPGDHQHNQQAVDLSVRPGSASSNHDDEASLRMNMLLWQRGQLFNQLPGAELSEAAVRHLIAGLYALPGREALNGLDPRLPLQELQEVAKKSVNSHQDAQNVSIEHQSLIVPRPTEPLMKDATTSSSSPQLPSVYDTLYNKQTKPEGPAASTNSTGDVKRPSGSQSKNSSPIDYSRYVKRFSSALECASPYCKDLSYREHFHCLDCQSRVFVKKEEMIRHFKWHKKRDESLQHGFMRYSPGDDCNDRYSNCPHNRKQTHYHCVKTGCDKVYISTSDVQMHANYHRKDSAIIQEGFQRFRATEDCATAHCAFNGQRTTHFHCRRAPCNYTFKNKADMEKHKSYHIKDEQLTRDGFKKFMKNEACNFENCRFSRVCNHIHCIRTGCNYVLHSSGQLYSHKRKHERRDAELAYQEGNSSNQITSSNEGTPISNQTKPDLQQSPLPTFGGLPDVSYLMRDPSVAAALLYGRLPPTLINQLEPMRQNAYPKPEEPASESSSKQFDCQFIDCQVKTTEHYHCPFPECKKNPLRSLDAVKEHVGRHEKQDRITENYYVTVDEDDETCASDCPHKKSTHYHCAYESCHEVISRSDEPFKRLDHYKSHEAKQISTPATPSPNKNGSTITASLDSMFRRKRGRPPKNRVIEVWNESSPSHGLMPDTPQAIFTSFKLPKPATSPLPISSFSLASPLISQGLIRPGSPDTKRRESPAAKVVQSAVHETSRSPDSPARNLTVVKASGTFFPSPALPSKHDELNTSSKESPGSGTEGLDLSQGSISRPSSSLERADSPNQSVQSEETNLKNGNQEDASFAYGVEIPCGRPFCKLKKREHYHCVACSQAFSEVEKLKPHMLKHCTGALSPHMSQLMSQHQPINLADLKANEEQQKVERSPVDAGPSTRESGIAESPDALSARSNAAFLNFHQPFAASYGLPFHQSMAKSPGFLPAMQSLYASQGFMMNGSPGSSRQSSSSPVDQSMMNSDPKKMRIQSSMRILKDEPVPEGYVRFRFNEDCQYPICGYREHQTHFHCMRRDCGYSFCDKTRFVQHTARHERLDTLMGGDFQQYRANVNCGRPDCPYIASLAAGQNKASHFHCLKCDFFCTDTNKVVAHRRQHQKTDSILAAGFEKFTPSQGCRVESCPHSTKQTHYHCLKCSYAVLGLAQMSAHKYRHMENASTP